jgi:hypothetical protein
MRQRRRRRRRLPTAAGGIFLRRWTARLSLLLAVATLCCVVCWQAKRVHALGTGAADCPGGRAAVGGGHLTTGYTQGTLDDGGITILFDGQPINSASADADAVLNFVVGQTHQITIARTTTQYFRGFLFRLGGGIVPPAADTITVFSTDSTADTPEVGLASICVSNYGVSCYYYYYYMVYPFLWHWDLYCAYIE